MAQTSSELKKFQKEEIKRRKAGKGSPDCHPSSKSPTLTLAPNNVSLSNKHEKDKDVEIRSLTDKCFCTTPETPASVRGSMVGDTLKYPSDKIHYLVQQFGV